MAYNPYEKVAAITKKAEKGTLSADEIYGVTEKGYQHRSASDLSEKEAKLVEGKIRHGGAYRDKGAQIIRKAYADHGAKAGEHTAARLAGENGGNMNSNAAARYGQQVLSALVLGEEAVGQRADSMYQNMLKIASHNGAAVNNDDLGAKETLKALLDLYGVMA